MNYELGGQDQLENLSKLIRYYILTSTTTAGSGHPSSSLSATDLMAVLFFNGFFKADLSNPEYFNNDRLIFSKGHASPLFYALYAVAGQNSSQPPLSKRGGVTATTPALSKEGEKLHRAIEPEELLTLRKFGSRLEGHPTMELPWTEVPTGSLGQGLSVGVGMALNAKLDKLDYKTFVLLGDSEMAEGSVWEAMASASHYKLNNLVAILDLNRLGQRGETMHGHDTLVYQKKCEAFGWETISIDGHNIDEIVSAYKWACGGFGNGKFLISNAEFLNKSQIPNREKPKIIIAKTLKGKGVSFMADKDGWHGKPLSADELKIALAELGEIDKSLVGEVAKPETVDSSQHTVNSSVYSIQFTDYSGVKLVATRKAYGNTLANLAQADNRVVVLDAETSNSTYSEFVKKNSTQRFFEMFIAEQNMAGVALGFSRRGKIPFVSTFAAFLTRAFDQIRMSGLAKANIKFCGSHAGVSIGEDGASQMGLEEIAMFRTLLSSVVLYPSDAVSTEKLVLESAKHYGNVYIQTTRKETPIIYEPPSLNPSPPGGGKGGVKHEFKIGGSCVLKSSKNDVATVVGAGITVHEALFAYEELKKEGINIRVIDLYSIKPIDVATLEIAVKETKHIITVEDNYPEGGIGEAVSSVLSPLFSKEGVGGVHYLAVRKMPKSGKPEELLAYEEIDRNAIIKKVKIVVGSKL